MIEAADELLQDVVASFSARPLTPAVRVGVASLYVFALFHLAFTLLLPFYRQAILHVVSAGAGATASQLSALATGIIIGGVSFHLAMMAMGVALSFLMRAGRPWTRALATGALGGNGVVAFNGLRTPPVARVLVGLHLVSLALSVFIVMVWWYADHRLRANPRAGRPGSTDDARKG